MYSNQAVDQSLKNEVNMMYNSVTVDDSGIGMIGSFHPVVPKQNHPTMNDGEFDSMSLTPMLNSFASKKSVASSFIFNKTRHVLKQPREKMVNVTKQFKTIAVKQKLSSMVLQFETLCREIDLDSFPFLRQILIIVTSPVYHINVRTAIVEFAIKNYTELSAFNVYEMNHSIEGSLDYINVLIHDVFTDCQFISICEKYNCRFILNFINKFHEVLISSCVRNCKKEMIKFYVSIVINFYHGISGFILQLEHYDVFRTIVTDLIKQQKLIVHE